MGRIQKSDRKFFMNILCTICARKGSKGIKNKNLLKLNGKSLMFHTIDQAKKVRKISNIVVSSDFKLSSACLKKRGIKQFFLRNKSLSNDSAGKVSVIRDALIKSEKHYNKLFDVIIDLDVTSPLRSISDITNALKKFKNKKSNNLITVCRARKNPYFNMVEIAKSYPKLVKKNNSNYLRRQDAPKVYEMNASIYIWKRSYLLKSDNLFHKKTSVYEMPYSRSIDIDENIDYKLVKYLINQ